MRKLRELPWGAILVNAGPFALSWLAWLVLLGGVAGMQAKCGGYPLVKVTLLGDLTEGCDTTSTTAFVWWAAFFEFVVLIIMSVAQCGRLQGLMLTKQMFLAMVSVVMMIAADKCNVVAHNYEGALEHSAEACLAGCITCIACNLVMLLYFGGELAERLPVFPRGGGGGKGVNGAYNPQTYNLNAEMANSSSFQPGPAFQTV